MNIKVLTNNDSERSLALTILVKEHRYSVGSLDTTIDNQLRRCLYSDFPYIAIFPRENRVSVAFPNWGNHSHPSTLKVLSFNEFLNVYSPRLF